MGLARSSAIPRDPSPASGGRCCYGFWPVDKKVGNVRNDGPDLIEPVPEIEPTLI